MCSAIESERVVECSKYFWYYPRLARNPTNRRSRHIGYRLQFVRDAVDYLQTRPHYVGTSSQPAIGNLPTKPGTATSLDTYGDLLGGIGT